MVGTGMGGRRKKAAKEELAENLLTAANEEVTHITWDKGHLELIKKAASSFSLPFEIYIKHVLIRQAAKDLMEMDRVRFHLDTMAEPRKKRT